MKEMTEKMLAQIDEQHDWIEGPTRGGDGTRQYRDDVCRVCSLERHYFSDRQNEVDPEYRFRDGETDQDLSLRQALTRGCGQV